MTRLEFSTTFDVLLNSYSARLSLSNQNLNLDEYEKSVLLTQAQDMVLKSHLDRQLNAQGKGVDDGVLNQLDFSSLIKTVEIERDNTQSNSGLIFKMPPALDSEESSIENSTDVLYLLNERLICTVGESNPSEYVIVPIHYREYDRQMSKSYRQPLKRQAWRLFLNNTNNFDIYSEIIPRKEVLEAVKGGGTLKYKIRYIKRPRPIILADLTDEHLSIEGWDTPTECEVHPSLHNEILNKAVELAMLRWGIALPSASKDNK